MELTKNELKYILQIFKDFEREETRKNCSRDFYREEMLENIRCKAYNDLKKCECSVSGII